jgi:hypothetical protein
MFHIDIFTDIYIYIYIYIYIEYLEPHNIIKNISNTEHLNLHSYTIH